MSNEWVSVKDELPKEWELVLLRREDGSIGIGSYIFNDTYTRISFNGTSQAEQHWHILPTHWQSLPSPPQTTQNSGE